METLTKLGQCIDYTYRTREAWIQERIRMSKKDMSNCAVHYVIQHILTARGPNFAIKHLDEEHVSELMYELEDEKGWSPRTTNKIPTYLGTVLTHCWEKKKIKALPYHKYLKRKVDDRRIHWFSKDEVEQLYYTALDPFRRRDLADNILVAAYTGGRQTEILKLTAKDVDLGQRLIHFGGRPDGHVTKARNWRAIPIEDRIFEIIERRCRENSGRLFPEFTRAEQLRRAYNKVLEYLKMDNHYVYHTLRHSFATWLNDKGVPIATIQALMGHKHIDSTMVYLKVSPHAKVEAMTGLSDQSRVTTPKVEPVVAPAMVMPDPQVWAKFLEFQAFEQARQMALLQAPQPV